MEEKSGNSTSGNDTTNREVDKKAKGISRALEWRKEYYFDRKAAKRATHFFENDLQHIKGDKAGQRFILEKWQWKTVRRTFGWKRRKDGLRKHRRVWVEVPKGNGKALDIKTPIPTPCGWKLIQDIKTGDYVFDEYGRQTLVLYDSPIAYNRPCYELTFSDGSKITTDAEHEWTVHCRSTAKIITITTAKIAENVFCRYPSATKNQEKNYRIDNSRALQYEKKLLPIEPYLLGLWLGDGESESPRISCGAADLAATLENLKQINITPKITKDHNNFRLAITEPRTWNVEKRKQTLSYKLRAMALYRNKHIPNLYLQASIAQRTKLLQGLMDSDGYCSKGGQCEFTTVYKSLALTFIELTRSLGYKPTIKESRAKFKGIDYGPKFRIQFWAYRDSPCFQLKRKIQRLKAKPKSRPISASRYIISAVQVPSVPVKCIGVANESQLYLAGEQMIPTHNTPLGAGFGMYLFAADKEPGSEVICAAADKEQASIAYEFARENANRNPKLKKLVGRAYRRSMAILSTMSTFKVVSSDAKGKHGSKIHGLILDEVHAIDDREYVETLIAGTAKRPRSLTVMLTTAGYDPLTICYDFHQHAVKVRDGILHDPELLVVIFAADEKDDWKSEATWRKANPNFDVTIMGNDLAAQARLAEQMPRYENSFKRLFLNIWTTQDVRWLPITLWDANDTKIDFSTYKRRTCYGGLDLASVSDIAALVLVFPEDDGTVSTLCRFWVPMETAAERQLKTNVPYLDWIKDGYMIGTEGNAIDFDFIRKEINDLANTFSIQELAIDRNFNAFQISTQLTGDGLTVVPFGQGYFALTAPSRYLETLLLKKMLNHSQNPILRWMASNVAVEQDAAGNIKPSKKKSKEKIDGIVALVMAIGRLIVQNDTKSVYETRGIIML